MIDLAYKIINTDVNYLVYIKSRRGK